MPDFKWCVLLGAGWSSSSSSAWCWHFHRGAGCSSSKDEPSSIMAASMKGRCLTLFTTLSLTASNMSEACGDCWWWARVLLGSHTWGGRAESACGHLLPHLIYANLNSLEPAGHVNQHMHHRLHMVWDVATGLVLFCHCLIQDLWKGYRCLVTFRSFPCFFFRGGGVSLLSYSYGLLAFAFSKEENSTKLLCDRKAAKSNSAVNFMANGSSGC